MVLGFTVLAVACGQPAPPPAPAKAAVTKATAPEFSVRPPVDRAAKKIAVNKPGNGCVAVLKAAAPPPSRITASGPVNGTLARGDERLEDGSFADFYTYAGTRGEQLTITMRSKAFDAYVLAGAIHDGVFDPFGEDDDSAGGTDARLDITVGTTGPLVIAANALSSGDTGPYTIEVIKRSGGGGGGDLPSLEFNTPANGRLEAGDATLQDKTYFDSWIFEGRGGQRVTITMRSDAFDAYLLLRRGAPGQGAVLAEDDDSGGGSNARLTVTLPESGAYTVVANSYQAGTGPYTLVVEADPARPGPAPSPSPGTAFEDRYPGTGDPSDKYALVVGIDDYPGAGNDLTGPVADAGLFRDLLIKKFGFKPANVVMLTNADATRDHVLNAFARHLGQAGPQGAAVFYYSGHGTQMPNNLALTAPLDAEADGRDEALYVWGTDQQSSVILDDEIGFLIDQLKTERVLLVHDSCNSGTSARGAGQPGRPKEVDISDDLEKKTMHLPRRFAVGAKQAAPAVRGAAAAVNVFESRRPYGLLAGSKDEELSWTASGWPDKGGVASVFTYYLVSTLEAASDTMTVKDVMDKVSALTVAYTRKTFKETQTPQLAGAIGARTVGSVLR
jgi:hypothetical protein